MFSLPLAVQNLKENWKLCLSMLILLLAAMVGELLFYYYDAATAVTGLFSWIPLNILQAFDMNRKIESLTGYLALGLYGSVYIWIPMIGSLILTNRLIAAKVENKYMAYLLSTPDNRRKIASTQLYSILLLLTAVFALISIVGTVFCIFMLPGELNIAAFLMMNLGVLLLQILITSIGFFASCICDEEQVSIMLGMGVPLLFYLIKLLSNMGGDLKLVSFLSIFSLYAPSAIVDGELSFVWSFPLMAILAGAISAMGIYLFNERDLPL